MGSLYIVFITNKFIGKWSVYIMTKSFKTIVISVVVLALLTGCGSINDVGGENTNQTTTQTPKSTQVGVKDEPSSDTKTNIKIDYSKVKPNESGKIMVVMFHNFIEAYKSGDKDYTTTFDSFRNLLQTLYDKGYRLINVNDYLSNNIVVPAGFVPMMFAFDDGTAGQFNLVEENGKLVANKQSAVGIMEEFNKQHPDFGLKGTFYVNLGGTPFAGKGTTAERLKYLIDEGFEIGNHTLNHIDLKQAKTAEKVQEEVGGNQKKMEELVPGYKMKTLALPLGNTTKDESLRQYIGKGVYQGVAYENSAIMLVGAEPALPSTSSKFNPMLTPRVRATGIAPVLMDLDWYLGKTTRDSEYVSDGDPNTITVPVAKESKIDKTRLEGKTLNTY